MEIDPELRYGHSILTILLRSNISGCYTTLSYAKGEGGKIRCVTSCRVTWHPVERLLRRLRADWLNSLWNHYTAGGWCGRYDRHRGYNLWTWRGYGHHRTGGRRRGGTHRWSRSGWLEYLSCYRYDKWYNSVNSASLFWTKYKPLYLYYWEGKQKKTLLNAPLTRAE